MFYDILQLNLRVVFAVVFHEIVVVEYRDEEQGQKCRSGKSPDDGPGKSAPDRIGCDDEAPKYRSNACENHWNEALFRSLDNCVCESFPFFHELIDVVDENDGIPDDDTSERDGSDHSGRSEVFSFEEIENGESREYPEKREEKGRHDDTSDPETLELCHDEEEYGEERHDHGFSEITEGVHSDFPLSSPFYPILFAVADSDKINPIRRGGYLFITEFLEFLSSKESIEPKDWIHNRVISDFRIDMDGFASVIGVYFRSCEIIFEGGNFIESDLFSARIHEVCISQETYISSGFLVETNQYARWFELLFFRMDK